MLLSMTGFGEARAQHARVNVTVEVRAVNNRYLKVSTKFPDVYTGLEAEIEKTVRAAVTRGTIAVTVRVEPVDAAATYTINRNVLENYWRQLHQVAEKIHLTTPTDLCSLLNLPGVIDEENAAAFDPEADRGVIQQALEQALVKLNEFRAAEGQSMQADLNAQCATIAEQLVLVRERAPQVVSEFRARILERVRELVAEVDVQVKSADVLREVSIFAERCDINEEIARLDSHLQQFAAVLNDQRSQGRKLEFLSQEMFREINTIGSKANDVAIAHFVVEMKAAVERLREVLQNVE